MHNTTNPFFNYTSNKWLYNEHLRLPERRLYFDIQELCLIIAKAVGRTDLEVVTKLTKGGSYRVFEATFRDGSKAIVRLPYPCTIPRNYSISSEVATMVFLRLHGVPIPRVFDWSFSAFNPLGSEYIIMEWVPGRELADTWCTMTFEESMAVIKKIVNIEKLLFSIPLPANGSLFFRDSFGHNIKW